MGSSTFTASSPVADVTEAYEQLHQQALAEYGHDPYNGTISTTTGFHVVESTPMTRAAADRLMATRIEALSKWGPCEAIAIGTTTKSRTRTGKVVVVPDAPGAPALLSAAAIAEAFNVPITAVGRWTVTDQVAKHRIETRPAGPVRRVWEVEGFGGLENSFTTRSAAIAAAKADVTAEMERHKSFGPGMGVPCPRPRQVVQRLRRDPEAAVVTVLVKATFTVSVEILSGPLTFDHWLFYGWAAT